MSKFRGSITFPVFSLSTLSRLHYCTPPKTRYCWLVKPSQTGFSPARLPALRLGARFRCVLFCASGSSACAAFTCMLPVKIPRANIVVNVVHKKDFFKVFLYGLSFLIFAGTAGFGFGFGTGTVISVMRWQMKFFRYLLLNSHGRLILPPPPAAEASAFSAWEKA